jgi:hypothetical protein
MNFRCTAAAFTLSPAPGGLRHLVLTHPGTKPSMRFLSVGSHLCARASFRHPLTGLPLPSASSYIRPQRGHHRYSYRGLSPHQFMPMPGVHKAFELTTGATCNWPHRGLCKPRRGGSLRAMNAGCSSTLLLCRKITKGLSVEKRKENMSAMHGMLRWLGSNGH